MKLIIDVADMKVSSNPGDILITYSLGSCIGISIYDPVAVAGGILHFMLPDSGINADKAIQQPHKFADTAIPRLFKSAYRLGAKKNRMKIIVAGGSNILDQEGFFNIGKRNHMVTRKIFFKNNVLITHEDTGGVSYRTMMLDIKTGKTTITTKNNEYVV